MKKFVMYLLAAILFVTAPTTVSAKTLEEALEDVNKSTDKIKDYLNDTHDTNTSVDVHTPDVAETETSDTSADLEVPSVKEVYPGLTDTSYNGKLEKDIEGLYEYYEVYNSEGKLVDSGMCSFDNVCMENITPGVYYVRVRSGKTIEGTTDEVYSKWSDKFYFITDPEIDNSYVKYNLKKNYATLKWSKVPGATKYEIYVSSNSGKSYTKVGSTSKTTFKVTKLKGKNISFKNTKYLKVVAVTKAEGKTVKSDSAGYVTCRVIGA